MWLPILALFAALSISSVSAYFSIVGLTAIFAAAKFPIIILGTSLELGKVITTLFVHRHWKDLSRSLRSYLSIAIVVLMMITSMGTFGFLSKAHLDQALPSNDNQIQLNILDQKIKTDQDNIAAAKQELAQLDQAVNQMMGRTTDATGAQRAVNIRKNQTKDRQRIAEIIDSANKDLLALQQQEAPLKVEQNKIAVEVGPIKYIADLIYGQSEDPNVLEKAVRIVIMMLVSVFDPLAIVLLLAASSIMAILLNKRKEEETDVNTHAILGTVPSGVHAFGKIPEPVVEQIIEEPMVVEDDEEELTEEMRKEYEAKIAEMQEALDIKNSINEGLLETMRSKEEELTNLKTEMVNESARMTELLGAHDETSAKYEKLHQDLHEMLDVERANNDILQKANDELRVELDTVNEKFTAYIKDSTEKLSELTDQILSEQQNNIELSNTITEQEGKIAKLVEHLNEVDAPEAQAERMFSEPVVEKAEVVSESYGMEFPEERSNGQLFVYVGAKPNTLYKFIEDYGWIVVDKATTDSYITDEYVSYLVEKLASGEYDFSELTEREQERITEVLTK